MVGFMHRRVQIASGDVVLLPSPMVVIAAVADEVRMYGPHTRVWHLEHLPPADALWCSPNLIKALLGHPRRFVNRAFTTTELPLLRPFREHAPERWPGLLRDLRTSVPLHFDEASFERRWSSLIADPDGGGPQGMSQRQEERIFLRYAGQTPARVARLVRLSAQLAADISSGVHTPLGAYADQSHYIRECHKLTGRTPTFWRTAADGWYGWNGTPALRPAAPDSTR